MPHAISIIPTRDGSRLIKRLCTHWAHKLQVQFDESQAHVPFDADTRLWLEAGAEALQARLEAPDDARLAQMQGVRSEEHTSELQSLMRISYAVFCLKKKNNIKVTLRMTKIM